MKNIPKILLPFLMVVFTIFSTHLNAQSLTTFCGSLPVVGSSCVGACGLSGGMTYQVGPLCPTVGSQLCLKTTSSSLCPSHDAVAYIYVGSTLVATGDISPAGSEISFSAPCGSKITVKVKAVLVNPGIACFWLGNVDFTLRSQY